MPKFRTHYDNLKVARDAPDAVICAAYKALLQRYHPDKYEGSPEEALRIAKIILQSFSILSDPQKRAEHDAWIAEQEKQEQDQDARSQQRERHQEEREWAAREQAEGEAEKTEQGEWEDKARRHADDGSDTETGSETPKAGRGEKACGDPPPPPPKGSTHHNAPKQWGYFSTAFAWAVIVFLFSFATFKNVNHAYGYEYFKWAVNIAVAFTLLSFIPIIIGLFILNFFGGQVKNTTRFQPWLWIMNITSREHAISLLKTSLGILVVVQAISVFAYPTPPTLAFWSSELTYAFILAYTWDSKKQGWAWLVLIINIFLCYRTGLNKFNNYAGGQNLLLGFVQVIAAYSLVTSTDFLKEYNDVRIVRSDGNNQTLWPIITIAFSCLMYVSYLAGQHYEPMDRPVAPPSQTSANIHGFRDGDPDRVDGVNINWHEYTSDNCKVQGRLQEITVTFHRWKVIAPIGLNDYEWGWEVTLAAPEGNQKSYLPILGIQYSLFDSDGLELITSDLNQDNYDSILSLDGKKLSMVQESGTTITYRQTAQLSKNRIERASIGTCLIITPTY